MEMKGKGAGAQGYPPRGLGQPPNSIESARPTKTRNSRKTDVHYRFLLTADKLCWGVTGEKHSARPQGEDRPIGPPLRGRSFRSLLRRGIRTLWSLLASTLKGLAVVLGGIVIVFAGLAAILASWAYIDGYIANRS